MINKIKSVEPGDVPMWKYAMQCGAILGVYMIFRYLFLIISGFTTDLFLFLYKYVLIVGDFLIIYYFYYKYKYSNKEPKSMGYCLLFTIQMCFFASFFESVIAYAHWQFIDPHYFRELSRPMVEMVDSIPKRMPNYPQESLNIMNIFVRSKITYIIGMFSSNLIMGVFLGLFIGLFNKNDNFNIKSN